MRAYQNHGVWTSWSAERSQNTNVAAQRKSSPTRPVLILKLARALTVHAILDAGKRAWIVRDFFPS